MGMLGKATSPVPSFLQCSIVLCVGWRSPSGLSPVLFGMFVGILFVQLMLGQVCW